MHFVKKIIIRLINKAGYQLSKIEKATNEEVRRGPFSHIVLESQRVVDLEELSNIARTIPGMISTYSGRLLYALCYFQSEQGDVVEIGSWQGRSASFLARATSESNNGDFYAIDHFKGNIGKEHYYVVEREDLSDLKNGFINNIKRVGLANEVRLLDMTNDEASKQLSSKKIRFLFIDGDHTKEGVQKDIELFFPMLIEGALVVFDDFSQRFPGMIEVIDHLLKKNRHSRVMTYANTLVLKYSDRPINTEPA